MNLDAESCYRALAARDPSFDGLFFVAIKTTGVYCRPICPAPTPRRERCVFFRTAAQAEHSGFRACLRCRPELAPGCGPVDSGSPLVDAATKRIEGGFLNDHSVDELANELGVTGRHLRRAMTAELGVSPMELAQSRRLALAKQILQDSTLSLADIALVSGFSSVRRFNSLFRARFGRPISDVRRREGSGRFLDKFELRLDYRPPLDWDALLGFLAQRAIPGVEAVSDRTYRRTVRIGRKTGWIEVIHDQSRPSLRLRLSLSLAGAVPQVVARMRALFDLDARPTVVAVHLERDPLLEPMVRAKPGLRVPGAFDGFETTVRAVLGQQISVRAATTISGRLAGTFGDIVTTPFADLTVVFPTPDGLGRNNEERIAKVGIPRGRARTLVAVCRAVARGDLRLERCADADSVSRRLQSLPGVGDWTASYVAMRVLGWPDAFPASDLGLRRAMGGTTSRLTLARAEKWRPWRAYAAMYLWTSDHKGVDGRIGSMHNSNPRISEAL